MWKSQKPFGFPSICDGRQFQKAFKKALGLKSLSAFRRFATIDWSRNLHQRKNCLKSLSAFRRFATHLWRLEPQLAPWSQKPFGFPSICDNQRFYKLADGKIVDVSKAFRLSVDLRPPVTIWNESTKALSQKPFGFPSICDDFHINTFVDNFRKSQKPFGFPSICDCGMKRQRLFF